MNQMIRNRTLLSTSCHRIKHGNPPIHILSVMNTPTKINVTDLDHQMVSLNWNHSDTCGHRMFVVSVYNSTNHSIQTQNTTTLNATITGVPMCSLVYFGVRAVNRLGSVSQEAYSLKKYIPQSKFQTSQAAVSRST